MNLPKLAIRRPVGTAIVFTIVIVLGVISLGRTPLDMLPELQLPIAAVITTYEGAGPREVENSVTRPIESALATIDGLRGLTSMSQRGQSIVVAEFAWGSDMDFVALDMREAIDMIRPFLPDDADDPLVLRFSPESIPILALTLGGDRSPEALRKLADDVIVPRLERLQGVASVGVSGGLQREIRVELHPGRLYSQQVSLDQVAQVLRAANTSGPGGTIQHEQREYILRTTGEFQTVAEIGEVQIPTASGLPIPLRHIATVVDGYKEVSMHTRLNFSPSVGISIQKESGANTVQVARRVHRELERLRQELGDDIELAVVIDQAEMIQDSIDSVTSNAFMGALIAAAVLWLFLRNFRAMIVVGIAIPLSVVATFVLIYFSGMSINIISLGGLALGIGMLVDNAIVVLENIYRHRSEGAPAREAAERGANEVASAIVASTLTTVSVFLPVLFVQGLARQIFQDMSLTVSFSLTMSLLVSLTVVPLLASRWLRLGREANGGDQGQAAIPQVGRGLQEVYARLLRWCLKRRGWVITLAFLAFIASMAGIGLVGAEFLPAVDQGFINISIELPPGSSLEETDRVVRRLEEAIYPLPEVASVYSRVGAGSEFSFEGNTSERATIDVRLVPLAERSRSSAEVAEVIRGFAADVPGAKISVTATDNFGGGLSGAPIQIQLRGDDEEAMERLLEEVAAAVRAVPGTREVTTSLEDQRPEYRIEVRRERIQELGLSVPQITSAVRTAVEGQVITQLRSGGEEIDIRLQIQGISDENLDVLASVPIWSPVAGMVPLAEVVRFVPSFVPTTLQRDDQSRLMTVSASIFGRPLSAVMAEVAAALATIDIPPGISVQFGGDVQEMQEAFGDLGVALVLAIFLVYAVMAVQFESFRHPFTIMFSVPLAAIGVVFGLVVTGTPLSVPGFIGLIMLAGIVVNNAIVLVDYVNRLRAEGMERTEALVQAGRTRLRPILMTTLTTVLGMLPLALGIGEGSEVQVPLAVVVIFGLTFSTFLTLVVVPIMYTWIDTLGTGRIARLFRLPAARRALSQGVEAQRQS